MTSSHGLPCWYELTTSDANKAQEFYTAILGWQIADSGTPGMDYRVARMDGAMVAGMLAAQTGQPLAWLIYFAVDSADATFAAATAQGATPLVPPADIPNTGRFAIMRDPQGAAFGVLQPLPGGQTGAFDQAKSGHGNWNELITPDPAAALGFYSALFGWTRTRTVPMGPDMTYHLIGRLGLEIGGTCALPDAMPHWKPYFAVPSANACMPQVTAAGGQVLHGPDEVPGGVFTVQIRDAQGVTLALVGPA